MTEREALFRSVLAAPDDDAPRLILADWLDEHNDPKRAEFIRVQCALAREERYSPKYRKLAVRERKIFDYRWQKTMKGKANHCEFARGFIDRITIFSKRFMTTAEDIFNTEPVQVVKLGSLVAERGNVPVKEFAHCPHLARLRGLDLSLSEGTGYLLGILGSAGHLRKLRELTINYINQVGRHLFFGLNAAEINSLEVLNWGRSSSDDPVTNRPDWTLEDFRQFAQWKGIKTLKTLMLPDLMWTPEMWSAFFAIPFESLECLDLSGMNFYYTSSTGGWLGFEGIKALAQSPHMKNLKELVIPHHGITLDGLKALTNSPYLKKLRRLHLHGNHIGPEGVMQLIESPTIAGLYWLNLNNCNTDQLSEPLKMALKKKFPEAAIYTS